MKNKIGKIFISGILILIMLSTYLLPTVSLAVERGNVKKVEYNDYTIYYSDDYFRHPSTEYDEHLATTSIIMTDSTVPRGKPTSESDTEWYQNQPELLHGYFDAIGFEDFETNEDYRKRTAFDTIGVACANRKVDDYTVIAVTVRSGGYYHEWANNVWLGTGADSDCMHEGWYNAANKLIDYLNSYATSKNITGKVKVWITGFSRGGATANIAAGLLDNKIDQNKQIFSNGATLAHDDLYAYTFEAPQGANYNSTENKKPGDPIYNNIWNIVNPNDLVTKVAMSGWGFTRFGTDKYITTEFFDPDNYQENRKTFRHFLESSGKYKDYDGDRLDMYGIPGSKQASAIANLIGILYGNPAAIGSAVGEYTVDGIMEALDDSNWVVEDDKKENYDSNIVSTIVLEEAVYSIGSRKDYTEDYQEHLKKLLYAFMDDVTDVEDTEDELLACALVSIIVGAVTDTYTVGGFGPNEISNLWATISSNSAVRDMKDSIIPLLALGSDIYSERPNELVTIAKNADRIFDNHQFEVNIYHLQSQDSYYIDDYNELVDNDPDVGDEYKIKKVDLRNNADFGRFSYKDFNDTRVFINDGNGIQKKVQIDGTKFGDSKIIQCDDGFAAGYYSYLTEEKLEVFVPIDHKYMVNMQSFSKKPYHDVTFAAHYYFSESNTYHKQKNLLKHFIDNVLFDSDFEQLGVDMRVYPKLNSVADLQQENDNQYSDIDDLIFLEGANQTYTIGDDAAVFRINTNYVLFENGGKVFVDDEEITEFTSKSGSTTITLNKDFLESLSIGKHTLRVVFNDDRETITKFTIAKAEEISSPTPTDTTTTEEAKAEEEEALTHTPTDTTISEEAKAKETTLNNPKTGDKITMWIILMVISVIGIVVFKSIRDIK